MIVALWGGEVVNVFFRSSELGTILELQIEGVVALSNQLPSSLLPERILYCFLLGLAPLTTIQKFTTFSLILDEMKLMIMVVLKVGNLIALMLTHFEVS